MKMRRIGVPPGPVCISAVYRVLICAKAAETANAGGESSGGGMNVVATGYGLTVAALASVPSRLR